MLCLPQARRGSGPNHVVFQQPSTIVDADGGMQGQMQGLEDQNSISGTQINFLFQSSELGPGL